MIGCFVGRNYVPIIDSDVDFLLFVCSLRVNQIQLDTNLVPGAVNLFSNYLYDKEKFIAKKSCDMRSIV